MSEELEPSFCRSNKCLTLQLASKKERSIQSNKNSNAFILYGQNSENNHHNDSYLMGNKLKRERCRNVARNVVDALREREKTLQMIISKSVHVNVTAEIIKMPVDRLFSKREGKRASQGVKRPIRELRNTVRNGPPK